MKKLSIALALILCLVMVVFCFAACGKKKADATTSDQGTTPSGEATNAQPTTPEATEPEATDHEHTQGTEYVIDTPATCGVDGSKSYHCTECNEIIPETVVAIPATGEHQYGEWTKTKDESVLGDGSEERTCTVCSHKDERSITFEPTIVTFTDASSAAYNEEKANIREIMGDKHFYPTASDAAGNDLLVEYSILWNDSMLNFVGTAKPYFHTCVGKENGTEEINNIAYWSPVADNSNADCKFAGGFEYGTMRTSEPGNPYPQMTLPVGDSINEFPNIGGFNGGDGIPQGETQWGWHRVQIRLHIDVTNEDAVKSGSGATYKCTTTIYIDGVLVSILSSDSMTNGDNEFDNKLFTAASDGNGGIAYTDVRAEEWIHAMRINSTKAKDGTTIYVVYGDVYMTCGKDFVQKIVKVGTPANKTLEVAEGVELDAKVWYREDDGTCTEHVWNGGYEVTKAATLLGNGTRTERCSICGDTREVEFEYEPDVQKFTNSTKNSYNPNIATLASIRGDEHFYTPGNDLLVEFSILWTEEIKDLRNDKGPYMDVRFTQTSNPDSTNKNIIYWSLSDNCSGSDCKFAGGFEWGGIGLNEPDNPYPKFTKDPTLGTTKDEYPNIGGANGGNGTPQGEDRYGWHRIGIRYRQEVANVDAVKAGGDAQYKLSLWVYIDGVLVVHAYDTDFIYKPGTSDERDYKLFTAESDGNGGIAYTDINDDMYFSGAYLHYKQMASGKVAYFSIADYSAKIGSEFVQNVARLDDPTEAQYEVEEGVFVPATIWYVIPCAEHTWDGNFTVTEEPTLISEGTKVEHCSVCGVSHKVAIDETDPIIYSTNWNATQRAANEYSIENPDDHKMTFGFKEAVKDIRGDEHLYGGNDLLIEFSFLYNETMANASSDGTLTVMYIENNNLFNINMKTGKITATDRTGDVVLFKADESGNIPIGEYGWHRFAVRIHQDAVNNAGTVEYTVIATAYLDGEKILEVDKTTYALSKHNGSTGYTGLLYTATIENDAVVCADLPANKYCDVYVMVECIYANENDANAGYVVVGDLNMAAGADFVQDVEAVADPAADTFEVADGVEVPAAFYYKFAD